MTEEKDIKDFIKDAAQWHKLDWFQLNGVTHDWHECFNPTNIQFKLSDGVKCGQYFEDINTKMMYILVGEKNQNNSGLMSLVNLISGTIFNTVIVSNIMNVLPNEWINLCKDHKMSKIDCPFSIFPLQNFK